jgi:hypothetical protein
VGEPCALDEAGIGQVDAGCAHGWCAADGLCAARCGDDERCEDGRICIDTLESLICEVPITDGQPCVMPVGAAALDEGCASAFCDGETCAAKAEADGACPSARDAQCPDHQYCDAGTCADLAALGEGCSADAECGAAYCATAGASAETCTAYAGAGAACDASSDVRCAGGLDCTAIGDSSACHAAGAYPNGASCLHDGLCGSGWCDVGMCRELLEQGAQCEMAPEAARCADELECFQKVCSPASPSCPLTLY